MQFVDLARSYSRTSPARGGAPCKEPGYEVAEDVAVNLVKSVNNKY